MGDKPDKPKLRVASEDEVKDAVERYRIDDTDKMLLRLRIDYPGAAVRELAEVVGLSRQAVDKRLQKPSFKRALADLQGTATEHLEKAQRAAARRLLTLINSNDEKIALAASMAALAPMLNKSKLDVDLTARTIIFATKIGESGGLVRETTTLDAEGKAISSKATGEEHVDG